MDYGQLSERFAKYERCRNLVLWVCSSAARCEGMRTRAEKLRHIALFATLSDALADPHDEIWTDCQGQRVALPRQMVTRTATPPG
jgi:hypothetical protein